MKLIRKKDAPIFVDRYGVEHPNLTVKSFALPEDKKTKWLEIHCGYFHSDTATQPMNDPQSGLQSFVMRFDSDGVSPTETEPGWPTYSLVKQDVMVSDAGELVALNNEVGYWMLWQGFKHDCSGLRFAEHWEVAP